MADGAVGVYDERASDPTLDADSVGLCGISACLVDEVDETLSAAGELWFLFDEIELIHLHIRP